jgi:hypothetical protein
MDLDDNDSNNIRENKEFLIAKERDGITVWYLTANRRCIAVTDEVYELAQSDNEPTVSFSLPHKTT